MYKTIVLPRALTTQILKIAHNNLGHNGTHRTLYLAQETILLERFKTMCYKTYSKILSMPKKK